MLRNSDTLTITRLALRLLSYNKDIMRKLISDNFVSYVAENATLNLRTANTRNQIRYIVRIHRYHLQPSLSTTNCGYDMMCQTVMMPSQCLCPTLNVSRSFNPPDPVLYISLLHSVGSPAFRLRPRAVPKKCKLLTSF
jgi:hypothetical protein